jgi:hypothetical protein
MNITIGEKIFLFVITNPDIKVDCIDIYDEKKLDGKKPYAVLNYIDSNNPYNYTTLKIDNVNPDKIIKSHIPSYLKKISISREYSYSNYYSYNLDNLASQLEKLKITNINLQMDNLPTNLYLLEILGDYSKKLDNLPNTLNIINWPNL